MIKQQNRSLIVGNRCWLFGSEMVPIVTVLALGRAGRKAKGPRVLMIYIYIYMLCFFAHRRPVEDISVFSCESGWFRCSSKSALLAPPANFVYSHQSLALELAALFSRDSIRAETGVYATLKTGICWRFSSKYNLIQEFTSNAVSRHQSD